MQYENPRHYNGNGLTETVFGKNTSFYIKNYQDDMEENEFNSE